ncbi:hypothetical protein V8G54_005893 [Vigna mungo]|uniref:Uncharacterized protein n=1 Tax=Vigna mungo TaxID=3915 RepID=A0AAQ3S7H5_VIGMU
MEFWEVSLKTESDNSPISYGTNTDMLNGPNNANRENMRDRPSRKSKMPNYLCDYITNKKNFHSLPGGSLLLKIKVTYTYQFGAFIDPLPMVEHNTRSKTIDDAILRLTQNQSVLTTSQNELNSKLYSIIAHLSQVNLTSPKTQSPPSPSSTFFKPHMKLEVPRFNGHDATSWIFKITQFFEYHSTPEEDGLKVASFYMDGAALSWFQWVHKNGMNPPLKPVSLHPTMRIPVAFCSSSHKVIKREVLALQPLTFTQAAALAKLQEDKFHDMRKGPWHRFPFQPSPISASLSSPRGRSSSPLLPTPSKTNNKKLFHEEMLARREKGLCYNCDEKFHPGHKCKAQETEVDSTTLSDSLAAPNPDHLLAHDVHNELSSAQITFNAFAGLPALEALSVLGLFSKKQVTILVDGGSTHNFIQDRVAKFLNLPLQPTPTLKVMVGNGSVIECHQICPVVPISIQGHIFTVDLHVLPISGADVVLGIQWLKTLGPIVTDYSQMTMLFVTEGPLKTFRPINSNVFSISTNYSYLPTHSHPQLSSLLHKYQSIFLFPTSLPPTRPTDHHVHLLPNCSPVTMRPYRYPHFQKCEIEELLHTGLIQPTNNLFCSLVLLVKKKDALNSIYVKDRFPLPTIDELLEELGGVKWFSKLDLRHYEFKVMPFGLCNAPSIFQATMSNLLKSFLHKFHHLGRSLEPSGAHVSDLASRPIFFSKQLEYLGHIVSAQGVAADPSKIQAMVQWPSPTSLKALHGFIGLTGFYRRFIKGYASIVAPLTILLKKDSFNWCPAAQSAFDQLKKAMTEAPVLALPNFTLPFQLETDASGSVIGVVLMQQDHPIAFFRKPFCPRLLRSSTYVRELHAITSTVKKWRQYLLGYPFVILTDHRSLKELMSQLIQTLEQQVYLSKLLSYDYTIQYRAGKHNVVADALSRPTDTCSTCQQTKYETQKPAGLLQPLPLPHDTWEDLSLAFIIGLPTSLGHSVILVVVDRFSKVADFGSSSVKAVDSLLTSRQVLLDQLRVKLEKAQLTMKNIADRHRRDVSFQVDDWVYVRLRPYRQQSLHSSTTPKLTKRYYGPFRITARIGPVAYQLDLPPSSKIHHVFHYSLLKLHKGPLPTSPTGLPPLALDNKPIIEPLAILDTKMDCSTSSPTKLTDLNSDYHLKDKVPFAAVGIDSNSPISSGPNIDMLNGPNNANKGNMIDRPSRKSKMPNYLCDYITK